MMENSEVERQEKERIWGLVNAGKAETKKLQEEKDQLKDSFTKEIENLERNLKIEKENSM